MDIYLETPRIILRTPKKEDIERLTDGRNTPFVMRYNLYGVSKAEDIKAELETYDTIVMVLKETRLPIGCIYVKPDDFRYHVNSKEISSWLTVENSSKGIMTEVCPAIFDYLFNKQGIDRLVARIFSPNAASIRLVERAGFEKEGYLKDAVKNKRGEVFDLAMYSMSKEDFNARKTRG